MKRKIVLFATIILATLILFGSCSKDDDVTSPTTYTFTYSATTNSSLITTDVMLFEYNSKGEVIATNTMDNCKTGTGRIFKANNNSVKVKVYIEFSTSSSTITKNRWVFKVFYLTAGQNINIDVNDNTILSSTEP